MFSHRSTEPQLVLLWWFQCCPEKGAYILFFVCVFELSHEVLDELELCAREHTHLGTAQEAEGFTEPSIFRLNVCNIYA